MNPFIRLSGKMIALPTSSPAASGRAKKRGVWKLSERPGGWLVATSEDGQKRRILVHEFRGFIGWSLKGYSWYGQWIQGGHDSSERAQQAEHDLRAQFPGKVRKVFVNQGQGVEEGDALVSMEAMKMEFIIRAPFSGKVTHVRVKEGSQVSPGEPLVEIEES